MKIGLLALVCAAVLSTAPLSYAEDEITSASSEILALTPDLGAGKKLVRRSCRACHGAKLNGAGSYPPVAGLDMDFIVLRLEQYRAGKKFGPNSPLMISAAKKLSDQDIANIAHYVVEELN